MLKRFCDRCKKEIDGLSRSISISKERCLLPEEELYKKEICEECANDFMNMIDYECGRYKLGTVTTISKEAE